MNILGTKKVIWVIIVFVFLVGGYFLLNKKDQTNSQPIKIGADFALTGNLAKYGEWAKNGVEVALEEINGEGGINGKKVQVIYEDNKAEPVTALSAYEKLKNIDKVKYVLTFLSQIALTVEKQTDQDKIIQMDLSATTPDYSTPNDYSFRTGIVATQLAGEMARILVNQYKVQKIALLYVNNDFGKGMVNVFKEAYKGEVVTEEVFDLKDTDMRTQLLKLKQSKVGNIFLVSQGSNSGLILKQAKEIGLNAQIYSDMYSIEGSEFFSIAGSSGEGIVYIAPKFNPTDSRAEVQNFVMAYEQQFMEPPNIFSAQAYDGMKALATALKDCEYDDTDCVKNNLYGLNVQGSSGPIKFDVNGDVQKEVELKTIKDGKFIKLEN